jgi:hypothetical protein
MTSDAIEELLAACAQTRSESRELVERAKVLCDPTRGAFDDPTGWLLVERRDAATGSTTHE